MLVLLMFHPVCGSKYGNIGAKNVAVPVYNSINGPLMRKLQRVKFNDASCI